MPRTSKIGDDAEQDEHRLNALAQQNDECLEEHRPAARLDAGVLERCDLHLDHVEELIPLGLHLIQRRPRTDHLFQRVELILREVGTLGRDAAAHGALKAVLLIDAVIDVVDGVLRPLGITGLIDRVNIIQFGADMVVNLLPCLRRICGRRRQKHEERR